MVDLAQLSLKQIGTLLLMEDHDLLDDGDDLLKQKLVGGLNGEVEEVGPETSDGITRRAYITFCSVATDECSAFPCGNIEADTSLTPDAHGAYLSAMVLVFDDLSDTHSVILAGSHTGAGTSDESYEAYFIGEIVVTPKENKAPVLEALLEQHHRLVLADLSGRLVGVARELKGYSYEELAKSQILVNIAELNRIIAAAPCSVAP